MGVMQNDRKVEGTQNVSQQAYKKGIQISVQYCIWMKDVREGTVAL